MLVIFALIIAVTPIFLIVCKLSGSNNFVAITVSIVIIAKRKTHRLAYGSMSSRTLIHRD